MPPEPRLGEQLRGEVWKTPVRLAYADGIRGLGGTVSPLLAGFALAAIATILTADAGDAPPQGGWAAAAFAASVGLLLYAMQDSMLCLSRSASPDEYLAGTRKQR